MAANPRHIWTAEEFLAFESASNARHELVDGEIYDVTGGSGEHSWIAANVTVSIGGRLDDPSCRLNTSDMMLKAADGYYLYPDLSIFCGEPFFEDQRRLALLNPILVFEVASSTSSPYDRGLKRELYQQMPTVQVYIIIDQDRLFVKLYTRQDDGWLMRTFTSLDDIFPLTVLGCELPLAEVCRGIKFADD